MKAAFIVEHGGPEVMQYGDLPDPVPAAGEVLVDVHAASVNGADWKVRTGHQRQIKNFPYVLGRDFSGVVSARGSGAVSFSVGEEVFGVCDVGQEGAYAEKIAISDTLIVRKPTSICHAEAAALSLAGLTAVISVEETLQVRTGERVFVQGGAGGVGSFAVQLAKYLGAYVITTTSNANIDYVYGLGPDQIIDYNEVDFVGAVSDCDAVFDTVGGEVAERSVRVLRPGGRAAFIASGPQGPNRLRDDVVYLRPKVVRNRQYLERIVELVECGAVRAQEVMAVCLSNAAKAQRISESRHFRGKLVLKVR